MLVLTSCSWMDCVGHSSQGDKNICYSSNREVENRTRNIMLSSFLEHVPWFRASWKWPAGTGFPVWRTGFPLLHHHQLVQHSFPHSMVWTRSWICTSSLPLTNIFILSFPTVPEQEEPNWIISRKCWYRSKISGNKSI